MSGLRLLLPLGGAHDLAPRPTTEHPDGTGVAALEDLPYLSADNALVEPLASIPLCPWQCAS